MAELADALDLDSSGATRESSSLSTRTIMENHMNENLQVPELGSSWATSDGEWTVTVVEVNKRGRGYNLTVRYGTEGPTQFFRLKDFLKANFVKVS